MKHSNYPLFVRRDLDGFFALMIDNLVQLLLIVSLCGLCGISADSELLLRYILPGAAFSILLGNLFYSWQAHQLAKRENRSDVCALPYGINTPSLLVYIFFVMAPVYQRTNSAEAAWQMGLLACFGSGVIEFMGAFIANRVRKLTPRAALLSTLAGIAIGFISMTFALKIYQRPLIAMLPAAVVLLTLFSRTKLPFRIPGGLLAIILGTICAWLLPELIPQLMQGSAMSTEAINVAWDQAGLYLPQFAGSALWELLKEPSEWVGYMSVIFPMGLFNVIGSMQNIESAEAAGDSYPVKPAMLANGVGTVVASLFGSCFPTTIYIGHPGWKDMGARAGYSIMNGCFILLICLTGTVGVISKIIPLEAGIAIVLWIGMVITAQAFQASPKRHAPAVALGLFPAIAAWGATVMQGTLLVGGGKSLQDILSTNLFTEVNGFLVHGLVVMERGFIFTCMILAAICACLIDGKYRSAAIWSVIAALFAFSGLTSAYEIIGNDIHFHLAFTAENIDGFAFNARGIGIGYLMFAGTFLILGGFKDEPLSLEADEPRSNADVEH
ncbi:MAG: NCS2 family permease [Gimesia sp.]